MQRDAMLLCQHSGTGCNDFRARGRQRSYELVRGARDQPCLGDHLGIGRENSPAMLHQLAADSAESLRECHSRRVGSAATERRDASPVPSLKSRYHWSHAAG